jgi:quinolinate synthase
MGECHVHKEINAATVNAQRARMPNAEVLVHPECGCAGQLIYEKGLGAVDSNGLHIMSTEGMARRAQSSAASTFIVATEVGILHRMRQLAPEKEFVPADPKAVCQYMKTITLEGLRDALRDDQYHVTVPEDTRRAAMDALNRMVQIG